MTLVVLAAVTAVVLAVICRGRPRTFVRPAIRRFGLLGIILVGLFTSSLAKSSGVAAGWLVVAALALVWFTAVNRGRPGVGLVLVGLILNTLVIVLNGGMPLSMTAIERAGVPASRVPVDAEAWLESRPYSDPLREELTQRTVLPWLGETVPLALPLRPAVATVGDVLVAAGTALFLFTGMTGLGRTVPELLLTPKEKRKERKSRKAAKEAEQGAQAAAGAGTAGAGFADSPMHVDRSGNDDEDEDRVAPSRRTAATAAVIVDGADEPAPASTSSVPAAPDETLPAAAAPIDPAVAASQATAAAAAAERKKLKRQLKKVKNQERKRLEALAALGASNRPDSTEPDRPEGPPTDRSALGRGTGTASPFVAPSPGTGRDATVQASANGAEEDSTAVVPRQGRAQPIRDGETESAMEEGPAPAPVGATRATDRPPD